MKDSAIKFLDSLIWTIVVFAMIAFLVGEARSCWGFGDCARRCDVSDRVCLTKCAEITSGW
jgi:hypothetical protein